MPSPVDMPRPVVVVPPRGAARPILVEVPHAGVVVPEAVRGELRLDEYGVQRDADFDVDRLYGRAPELGATLVYSQLSRFVVDLNRAGDDVDARSVVGAAGEREAARGLIWRLTTDGVAAITQPLPATSYRYRIDHYYTPYHAALDAEIARLRARFPVVIVLSGHSMPSVGKATHADPGRRRADVVPGDRRGSSCDALFTDEACRHFTSNGLSVARNDPYQGGNTTVRLGRPGDGVHALQVELNRALYMDEASFAIAPGGFARLAALCDGLVDALARLAERYSSPATMSSPPPAAR